MSIETFLDGRVSLLCGDARERLREIPDASIDSGVMDPPYALVSIVKRFGRQGAAPNKVPEGGSGAYARASAGFMGKSWDTGETAFDPDFWREVWRVLKPGAHLIAFGGTRSYHRLAVAIEDAGFEIRDSVLDIFALDPLGRAFMESLSETQLDAFCRLADLFGFEGVLGWLYGTGFPKSHDVSKAIDKAAGVERPVIGRERLSNDIRGGALLDAAHDGNRPAYERDITGPATANAEKWQGWGTALKPAWEPIVLARKPLIGTVAENVLEHGTGAINIDGCRIEGAKPDTTRGAGGQHGRFSELGAQGRIVDDGRGRHPANILHDGSEEVLAAFPDSEGQLRPVTGAERAHRTVHAYGAFNGARHGAEPRGDSGSAARFFYSAKADSDDRIGSKHPTVKPVDLMQWCVRLITPPGGTVLDCFAGTGTTGEAAWREGFRAVLIEREAEYQADIRRRMALALAGPSERRRESAKARDAKVDLGPLFQMPEAAE